MSDYGFRISHDGYDVKDCDDINCVMTSKYFNFKGAMSGTVTITKSSADQTSALVNHNLGYQPICLVYTMGGGETPLALINPFPVVQGFPFFSNKTDENTLYVRLIVVPNGDYTFKYFIFLDKGKLWYLKENIERKTKIIANKVDIV